MSQKYSRVIPLLVLGTAVALAAASWLTWQELESAPAGDQISGFLGSHPQQLEAFSLTDNKGKVFGLEQLQGKWSFLFFGYTHCPDVCPATLQHMKMIEQTNGPQTDVQYIFVSVDSGRDSPATLDKYVTWFHPDFIGLTGDAAEIGRFTRQLGIAYEFSSPDADGNYAVIHTAAILLIDPQARFVGVFAAPHNPDDIAARYTAMRRIVEAGS